MKIEGSRTADVNGTEAAHRPGDARSRRGSVTATGSVGVDRVEVSADLRLLSAAVKATEEAAAIRLDVVERMRQKLAAGELGQDSGRLADVLLDDLLKR